MTQVAALRKGSSHVVRICSALVILQVAANATDTGEVVVVVNVAIGALSRRNGMTAR